MVGRIGEKLGAAKRRGFARSGGIWNKEDCMSKDREMVKLEKRIENLENAIRALRRGEKEDILSGQIVSLEKAALFVVDAQGGKTRVKKKEELGVVTLPNGQVIRVGGGGTCSDFNSGFPDYEHTCSYAGSFWTLLHSSGAPFIWATMEVGVRDTCEIAWEDKRWWYWINHQSHQIGFDSGRQTRHRKWSTWAKFRLADGTGINVQGITCLC